MNNLYWESQKGGLCRLHALNAYFGYKRLQEADFNKYCLDYDKYIQTTYKEIITSQNYDIFPVYTLIAYIIKQLENKYCFFIGLDQLKNEKHTLTQLVNTSTSFFVFNTNHIYTVKIDKGKWYTIDSLRGILPTSLNKFNGHRVGFIIPRESKDLEFDQNLMINKIKIFLDNKKIKSEEQLKQWIIQNYKNLLLDDLEIYLGHLNQILEIKGQPLHPLDKLIRGFYNDKNNQKWIGKILPRTLLVLNLINKPISPKKNKISKSQKQKINKINKINKKNK